jgi:hypothetical protein
MTEKGPMTARVDKPALLRALADVEKKFEKQLKEVASEIEADIQETIEKTRLVFFGGDETERAMKLAIFV